MNHDNFLPSLPWKEGDGKLYDSVGNLIAEGNVTALRFAERASNHQVKMNRHVLIDLPTPYQDEFG